MILVADSGASKTDWVILRSAGKKEFITTEGYNPFFSQKITWKDDLLSGLTDDQIVSIETIYYFGAGCNRPENTYHIKETLLQIFENAEVEVHDDLLGAAIGLWQDRPGVVAILGTGTNVGLYDGTSVIRQIVPMGYVLGDHGSGAVLGKRLLQACYNDTLPGEIIKLLDQQYNLDRTHIKEKLYNEQCPNHFLAGFVPFMVKYGEIPAIKQLIQEEFMQFFRYQIIPLNITSDISIRFTGSVAYYFQDILKETGRLFSVNIGLVERYPIHLLADYYQKKIN